MDETAKYLIHADITAAGVVERSDVVGAVFGQTEGLLGNELDLRDLQDSKKVGRIDVDIGSEEGTSYGQITVESGLDKVETAILAAALETIEQVGPCTAEIVVTDIEDIRSAKRREVVERATELLATFEAQSVRTEDIVETVRERARVEDITEYETVDYVAVAPRGNSVEDLSREAVLTALREKIPYEQLDDGRTAAVAGAEGEATAEVETVAAAEEGAAATTVETDAPTTLSDHIDAVIGAGSGEVRLLDAELGVITEGSAAETVSLVEAADRVPETIVLDDACSQKVLDVAAQRGVDIVVATGEGEYVKQPTSVRIRTV